jgi:fumarate reductase flavoprotein subunit
LTGSGSSIFVKHEKGNEDMDKNGAISNTEKSRGLSRRQFLAGSTIAGTFALAGLSLTSCSPEPTGTTGETPASDANGENVAAGTNDLYALEPIGEPTETITADIAIIGGGGSGLAAAIQAAQLGLKTVILEKMGTTGGSYICTEGILNLNSHYQKEIGIAYDIEEWIAEVLEYNHWIISPALLRAYANEINETVGWCDDIGLQFNGLIDNGEYEKRMLIWKHDPESSLPGTLAAKTLIAAAEREGVEILTNTPAKRILREGDKISGVLAENSDGVVLKVETPVVVLASGGFGQNEELLKELAGFICKPYDVGMPGRSGDGLKMGLDVGAQAWDFPGTTSVAGPVVIGTNWPSLGVLLCLSPLLWINQNCQRFVREDFTNINFAFSGNAAKLQERVLVVCTQKDLDHYENVGPYSGIWSLIAEGTPMPGLIDHLMELKDREGTVYIGDTIEELAQAANLDAAALTGAIQRYNGLCSAGLDSEFGKNPYYLHALEDGPYYALECADVIFGTCGTMYVSSDCECLDADYNPIPGLYAAGTDAGGLYGDSYDVNYSPCSVAGWALSSGRIVAKNAEKYIKG